MILSGWAMKRTKTLAKELSVDQINTEDIQEMFNKIKEVPDYVEKLSEGHICTTTASSAGQIVLMTILIGNSTGKCLRNYKYQTLRKKII